MKVINQFRTYYQDSTESELYVPGNDHFCYILEDVGRPVNVKVYRETCIPEGVYDVYYSKSRHFNNKEMLILSNQENKYEIIRDGISYKGVRVHGGNTVDNTLGCLLANHHNDNPGSGSMYGRASDDLLAIVKPWIDAGEDVKWVISS